MPLFSRKIKLPQSIKDYEALVDKIVAKYDLTDRAHASAWISVAIRRLPNEQAYSTYDFLGHSVMKNIANYVANHVSEKLQHETQIRQLEEVLRADPNDQEAKDALEKAANEGSELAKATLNKLTEETGTHLSVVPSEMPQA